MPVVVEEVQILTHISLFQQKPSIAQNQPKPKQTANNKNYPTMINVYRFSIFQIQQSILTHANLSVGKLQYLITFFVSLGRQSHCHLLVKRSTTIKVFQISYNLQSLELIVQQMLHFFNGMSKKEHKIKVNTHQQLINLPN